MLQRSRWFQSLANTTFNSERELCLVIKWQWVLAAAAERFFYCHAHVHLLVCSVFIPSYTQQKLQKETILNYLTTHFYVKCDNLAPPVTSVSLI